MESTVLNNNKALISLLVILTQVVSVSMFAFVLVFVVVVATLVWLILDTRKPEGFPPGPQWMPLLGNLLHVKKLIDETRFHHLAWAKLADQYGPVVGLKLGRSIPMILVTGRDVVQEILANEDFDGRPDGFVFQLRTMGTRRGVLFTDGDEWKEQRRFLLRNLREFGFGKRSMEALILDEARACVENLRFLGDKNHGVGVEMHEIFTVPVINSLWSLIAGVRFDDDHPTLLKFIQLNTELMKHLDASGGLLNHMPELRHLAPVTSGYTQFVSVSTKMWTFFSEFVWEHKETIGEEDSRDLIDVYLKELQAEGKEKTSHFSEMQLVAVIKDLFGAGSETSSNTLSYTILYMILHPEVQVKVQQEIDRVVGRNRPPSLSDRSLLSYTNAVIMEVQRIANIAPLTLPHRAVKDCQINGYRIPQDTTVLLGLWSLHMDVDHWGDPQVFRPERFLDEQGQLKCNEQWFMPFGSGRRRCLGENMAKDTLFLFFSLAMQQLTFSVPANQKDLSSKGVNGFTLSTGPFKAVITGRD